MAIRSNPTGRRGRRWSGPVAFLLLTQTAGIAAAQGVPPPGLGQAVPQGSPLPRILPSRPPGVGPGLPPIPPAGPGQRMPAMEVAVRSVSVEGATAYPAPRLAPLLAGLTGPAIPLARIEAARLAILDLYRADGFVLTTVTANLDAQGNLRVIVVEGRIAEVKLEGDIGPAATQVLRFLNHLTEERPVSSAALERWLLLANDVPGVGVRAVLRPSTGEPGALTLVAQVTRQAVSGLATADNRAFRLTGPQEGLAVVDLNSVSEFGEKTELSIYHTNGNTQNFGQGAEEFFVGGSGLRVRLYGGYGETTPSEFLRAIGYHGYTTVFGASAIYPVIRAREQTLNVSAYLDAIETEIKTISPSGVGSIRQGRDSLRVGRIGADWARQDLLLGDDRSAVNTASLRLSQGMPFLGGIGNDNPTPSRVGERTDFTKFAFQLVRTQTLFAPWPDATVALKGLIAGQASGDVLPPAEKFFLGGPEFTRGFYSGEVTGDSALAWTAELQLNTSFEASLFGRLLVVASQFYAFFDRGEAWQNQATDRDVSLSSEGIGLRLNLTRYTEFDVEGVIRNTRLPQSASGAVKAEKADAAFWRVLTRF
jgi:hemolysin activation/secretion protein